MVIRIFLIVGFACSVATLSAQEYRPITQPQVIPAPVKQAPVKPAQVVPQQKGPAANVGKTTSEESELEAIRKSSHAFEEAFNKADAKAVAALWTIDGDYVDETGQVFAGRDAIEKQYADFFANHQAATRFRSLLTH